MARNVTIHTGELTGAQTFVGGKGKRDTLIIDPIDKGNDDSAFISLDGIIQGSQLDGSTIQEIEHLQVRASQDLSLAFVTGNESNNDLRVVGAGIASSDSSRTSVIVQAGAGNDTIFVDNSYDLQVYAEDGNDTVNFGSQYQRSFIYESGDSGSTGNDVYNLGQGSDYVQYDINSLAPIGRDDINGFTVGQDTIAFDNPLRKSASETGIRSSRPLMAERSM